jgi:hypothetical protein
MLAILPLASILLLATGPAPAPTPPVTASEADALRATALDYLEGYYTGDAARMERAVHPELAKRIVYSDGPQNTLSQMSAMTLVNATRAGYGKNIPEERRQKDVTILDVYENAAVVKVVASDWVDYLEMARWNGQWKIVNVLWELKPEARAKRAAAREKK